ncbi:hypothetical protein A9Q84_03055 [Halobacteriovorax marinus]|uniref:Short-chain dehydrogenase n=1 Tax=Halobacteriovorax marinus TaxID=97084 RepID=A0A1Y5FJJ7_9BACT|nr:hypothetical protein A9Q84_03055 [Halobacteriovorax marinus]
MNYIIAGASKGVGLALVEDCIKKDIKVFAIARNVETLKDMKESIDSKDLLHIYQLDLTNSKKTSDLFDEIKNTIKGRSVLVNCCATWTGGKEVKEISPKDMLEAINLNFMTSYNPIYEFINKLSFSKDLTNTIVSLGATASTRGGKKTSSFAVGKSSLRILSQSLAKEMGPKGLHVAHIIIDGLILNKRTLDLNPGLDLDKYIHMNSIINQIHLLVDQPRDAWTLELDIRPYNETF